MTQRFQPGQSVRVAASPYYRSPADGEYTVVQRMPDRDGEPQYRIKSAHEAYDRVVREGDLEMA